MARFKKYKSKITPRRVARVIEANRALRTQVNAQAKGAEQSALIKLGQRLTSQSFGDGPVADDLRHAETLDQLREKFRACWVRGSGWRLEVGELLYKIKQKCEHGEWGGFLAEYDLARSTADDYIRHYKDTAQITETRQFEEPNPTPAPDPQAEGRKKEIEEEQKKRKGKKRTHHATEIRAKIKNLRPDQTACYWKLHETAEGRERIQGIWMMAFETIIGEQPLPPAPKPSVTIHTEGESEPIREKTILEELESCTAS